MVICYRAIANEYSGNIREFGFALFGREKSLLYLVRNASEFGLLLVNLLIYLCKNMLLLERIVVLSDLH